MATKKKPGRKTPAKKGTVRKDHSTKVPSKRKDQKKGPGGGR